MLGSIRAPYLARLTAANDALVPGLLRRQDPGGAVVDAYGIPNVHDSTRLIAVLATARHAPGSRHQNDDTLVEPLERAAAYLLEAQHDDGTIDLLTTNFHSPPDTAFLVESIGAVAALLHRESVASEARLRDRLDNFLRRAGEALVTGGIHTPNHRWVVCAALARVHERFPDRRYAARVEQWLAETIDIDPDGEVVTEMSKRQDKYQRGSVARYYYSYRTLARLDGNGRFAAMAAQIERKGEAQLTGELLTFLEEPEFGRELPAGEPLPTDYAKVFAYSNLARIRRGRASGTVLAQNPTVFSFRKGAAALEAVRLASAFFGKGQFIGEALEFRDGSYHLEQKLAGPYFQPLSADQIADGEHVRMAPNGTLAVGSRAARAQSNVQYLTARVRVSENAGRFRLALDLSGTDGVPVAVELAFRHGGQLEGVVPVDGIADAFLLNSGAGRYTAGNDTIFVGPGRSDHSWTQLRGAVPKWDGQSVYLTGYTPFRINFEIS